MHQAHTVAPPPPPAITRNHYSLPSDADIAVCLSVLKAASQDSNDAVKLREKLAPAISGVVRRQRQHQRRLKASAEPVAAAAAAPVVSEPQRTVSPKARTLSLSATSQHHVYKNAIPSLAKVHERDRWWPHAGAAGGGRPASI